MSNKDLGWILFGLMVIDGLYTGVLMHLGYVIEINPIMKALGALGIIIVKVVIGYLIARYLMEKEKRDALLIGCGFMFAIIYINVLQWYTALA